MVVNGSLAVVVELQPLSAVAAPASTYAPLQFEYKSDLMQKVIQKKIQIYDAN